eukprot:CAMPEP_0172440088 /NCGR_PEP_ID=MMETSP1065-20121228/855_1 /TAXON_ID=265537 /ORGANISM="Amphiprora paludosa, Strain CCMP125" /LENGTH=677 /DNA_ID=CAMNT_0013188869 /DNA_START=212 /DNA_END=2245 /DNA_ORIENTATION=-
MRHQGDVDVLVRPRPQRVERPYLPINSPCPCENANRDEPVSRSPTEPATKRPLHVIPRAESPFMIKNISNQMQMHIPVPKLVRPVAMKVTRPIPKSAVEQFYEETYKHGIKAEDVHEATILAQDWHRKWTQQDEQGHTMPQPEADSNPYATVLMQESLEISQTTRQLTASDDDCSYNPFNRLSGAKNPSPEDVQQALFFERKRRLRLNANGSLSSVSPDPEESKQDFSQTEQSEGVHLTKRRVIGYGESIVPEGLAPPERPSGPSFQQSPPSPVCQQGILKPTALRVHRPQPFQVSKAATLMNQQHHPDNNYIPEDIIRELRNQTTLSPLTLPSVSSSYRVAKAAVVEEDQSENSGSDSEKIGIPSMVSHPSRKSKSSLTRSPEIDDARDGILHRLAITGGDVISDPEFLKHLDLLKQCYASTKGDTRIADGNASSEGMWLTLTKPTYFANLGNNDDGDPMYTLGRMSFDMFSPTRLVCSLQGNFNSVERIEDSDRAAMLDSVPKALREEVEAGNTTLRSYNIITAFTIEPSLAAWPDAPNKDVRRPIRGLMTSTGYTLPDPENPNRHSVWITGGRIEPNDDPVDRREWKRQFAKNPPKHGLGEQAKLLAVKLLMGATVPNKMEEDGSMEYSFQRPLGGHGLAYVDTLYVDDSLRIVQGHRGTIFVFSKLPEGKSEQ